MITIYLSGKMKNLQFPDWKSWRNKATEILVHELGFKVISSFKFPEETSGKEIWDSCYFKLDHSDIILVNLDYPEDSPFLGTSIEISRAYMQNKPIIVFSSQDWVKNNATLKHHATIIVSTLDEAINYINDHYSI